MAYNADGFQKIAFGGAIAATFPDAGSVKNLYSYVSNDDLGTILTDAYFDGITGDPLVAGDAIVCSYDVDGTPSVTMLAVTVGGSDVTVVPHSDVAAVETATTVASTALRPTGITNLTSTAAIAHTMQAPFPGAVKYIFKSGGTTTITTVNSGSSLITFDGTNDDLDFDAAGEAVLLVGLSATRWAIIVNTGSVALST